MRQFSRITASIGQGKTTKYRRTVFLVFKDDNTSILSAVDHRLDDIIRITGQQKSGSDRNIFTVFA